MKFLVSLLLIPLLLSLDVYPQQTKPEIKHFEKAGLSFDYPVDWVLRDSSTDELVYLDITPAAGAAQIAIIAQLDNEENCDFQASSKKTSDALLERIASKINAPRPVQTSVVKTHLGVAEIEGLELHGMINTRQVTSEVYSFRLKMYLVNLIYLRFDDDGRAQPAWESMRNTLKLPAPIFRSAATRGSGISNPNVVLNGRAIHLVHPAYPALAKQAHASGTVIVQVVIDEAGNVVSANAISGHPLLQSSSVLAAKLSKFSPTKLCGEPVRVSGVIVCNFFAS